MSTTDDKAARTTPTETALPPPDARQGMADFLVDRLADDLAVLWYRDGPGMPAQVAVLDDLLTILRRGDLPDRLELRLLLLGYGLHHDYDPAWVDLLPVGP